MKPALLLLTASLALTFLPGASLTAATVMETGHVDLEFNYGDGAWDIGIHHDVHGHPAPDVGIFYAFTTPFPSGSAISRPTGSQWDFTGVGAGETLYLFPQTQVSGVLWPGFSSEETAPGTFAAYSETDSRVSASLARWITVSLVSVAYHGDGAGHVSLWSTGGLGATTMWMSTADGIGVSDKFLFLEGGHTHLNWGFSDIGFYEITLRGSAFLNDGSMTSTSSQNVTFQFGIGTTAIPEPGVVGLLLAAAAIGLLAALAARFADREKHRQPARKS